MSDEEITCCVCGKDTTSEYFTCDEVDGEWCPKCFNETNCGRGKHGEGCPTKVFGDSK